MELFFWEEQKQEKKYSYDSPEVDNFSCILDKIFWSFKTSIQPCLLPKTNQTYTLKEERTAL